VTRPGRDGTPGRDVATTFTGLATRGPAAGVATVFPDGRRGVWHVAGAPPAQPDLDDAAFLRALASHLGPTRPVFLAGSRHLDATKILLEKVTAG
jgi:poly(3-hydroxybutyrate) depolymerase